MTQWLLDSRRRRDWHLEASSPGGVFTQEILIGDLVKITFSFDDPHAAGCAGECMWVRVVGRESRGTLVGCLVCHPLLLRGLRWGDVVEFEKRHVRSVRSNEDRHTVAAADTAGRAN